jgi:hypothetical protein
MNKMVAAAALAGLAMLAACGDQPGAGGLTEEDNRELNNAAEMLDASPDSLVAGDEATLGNGEAGSAETGDVLVTNDALATGAAGNGQ